jgi:inhibitor of KinA
VCYDTKFGLDLTDLAKSRDLSVGELIDMHCAPSYVVGAIGFAPGFPYLEGINPKLIVPRRANPRVRVPSGSVALAANYTGIYPSALPGGWHIIGRTNTRLFSFEENGGALLRVGDRVRFNCISREEFDDTNQSDRKTSEK